MPIVNLFKETDAHLKARKDQEDPWVMYLVVNEDLNMSPGKIAAQCGHAVAMMYETYFTLKQNVESSVLKTQIEIQFDLWKEDSFRKVTLKASAKEWQKVIDACNCVEITDAGLTEINPGSKTVLGIYPLPKSKRPQILKRLRVL